MRRPGLPMLMMALGGALLGALATLLLTGGEGPAPAAMAPAPPTAAAAPPPPPREPAPDASATLEQAAARQALAARLRNPDTLRLQDVRVWQFGPADERAVCGTLHSTEVPGGTARFVVRVLQPRDRAEGGGRTLQTVVEDAPWLVRPTPEAARRFCRDAEPEAPPPSVLLAPRPAATGAPASLPPPAEGPPQAMLAGARPRVVTHSPANLRAAPSGEVLFSVPRGRTMAVFDRAPGGWVQVGDLGPEGWIHSSLLTDAAP